MADKVTDIELRGIINQEINNSLGYMGGNLSAQRKKSLEYYMGEPLGTEIDGRSQVVSTDVADTIETILPNLLKIFSIGSTSESSIEGPSFFFLKFIKSLRLIGGKLYIPSAYFL